MAHVPASRAPLKSPDYYLSEESINYESHSPYPPSVSSSDSETDSNITHSLSETHQLHESIATLSEHRLREIMFRLVNRNTGFKHAVAKELSLYTPSKSLRRRKSRKSGRPGSSDTIIPERKCARCGKCVKYGKGHAYLPHEKCVFHPGHLEEEVYEFLSRTPEGHSLNVVRTVTMWSCCDEDAWTLGCATTLAHQVEESDADI